MLRNSRTDIRSHDWAKPAHREPTTKYFKLCRAHEEITRLNVEVHRLHTAIHDETVKTSLVIDDLLVSNPLLAAELKSQWCSRAAINAIHLYRLDQIETLVGFSGVRGIGTCLTLTAGGSKGDRAHPEGELQVGTSGGEFFSLPCIFHC